MPDRTEDIKKRWFPEHQAVRSMNGQIDTLSWRKPGTGIYSVRYLVDGSRLIVSGDVGDAIYQWSERVSFEFIASLSLDYFAGKCAASEYGRGNQTWNPEHLQECLEFHFDDAEEGRELRERWEQSRGSSALAQGEGEWTEWLRHDGHEVFGCDWWDMGLDGMWTSMRCEGHLLGIKMAMEQLNDRSKED